MERGRTAYGEAGVTEKVGWLLNPSQAEYDLTIYGGEPAGLSAAVYGASDILLLREGIRGEIRAGKGIGFLADGKQILTRDDLRQGTNYRRLKHPNEEAFHMNGLYYGAGSSEAALCKGEHVFVVGAEILRGRRRCTSLNMPGGFPS